VVTEVEGKPVIEKLVMSSDDKPYTYAEAVPGIAAATAPATAAATSVFLKYFVMTAPVYS